MTDDADPGPRAISSLAVTTGDVVAAYEARQRSARRTVLRATPPFSGRMRARLHEPGGATERERDADAGSAADPDPTTDLDSATGTLHVPPSRFVDEEAVPPYPDPDDTEDALRADPDAEFTVERHRQRHVEAVEEWRDSVVESLADSLELRLPDGTHAVGVSTLGDSVGE